MQTALSKNHDEEKFARDESLLISDFASFHYEAAGEQYKRNLFL